MPASYTNGKQQYVGPGSSLSNSPLTVELWYYARSGVTTQQYLVELAKVSAGTFWHLFQLVGGVLNIVYAGQFPVGATGAVTLSNGKWYHLAYTMDNSGLGTGVKFYVNGVYDAAGAYSNYTANLQLDGDICVGGRSYEDAGRLIVDACVHKVRVYNRELTPTEIANRAADPYTYDYVTTYASNLKFRADYDSDLKDSVSNALPYKTIGTVVLTDPAPLNLVGAVVDLDVANAANTITSGVRVSTLSDRTLITGDWSETGTDGPAYVNDTSLKVGVKHAAHPPSGYAAKYVSRATGGGHTFDNQNCSIVSWMCPRIEGSTGSAKAYFLSLGNPASSNSGVLELAVAAGGKLSLSRHGDATEDVQSDLPLQCALPRMIAVACSASNRIIQVDATQKSIGSAFTSATAQGGRLGSELNGTTVPYVGDTYRVTIFGRVLSLAEMTALYQWGKSGYFYEDFDHLFVAEGSSTMDGYSHTNNENIMSQFKKQVPTYYLVNYGNSGENRGHFYTGYAGQGGLAAAAFSGLVKSKKLYLLQAFANDFDGTTSDADIENNGTFSNYTDILSLCDADYGHVGVLFTTVRTSYGSDAANIAREVQIQNLMAWITPRSRVIPRPAEITPASGAIGDLTAVSGSAYYAGDGTHLSQSGYRLFDMYNLWVKGIGGGLPGLSRSRGRGRGRD